MFIELFGRDRLRQKINPLILGVNVFYHNFPPLNQVPDEVDNRVNLNARSSLSSEDSEQAEWHRYRPQKSLPGDSALYDASQHLTRTTMTSFDTSYATVLASLDDVKTDLCVVLDCG